jgi:uncharacterized membrane protein (DUF4010 family)
MTMICALTPCASTLSMASRSCASRRNVGMTTEISIMARYTVGVDAPKSTNALVAARLEADYIRVRKVYVTTISLRR